MPISSNVMLAVLTLTITSACADEPMKTDTPISANGNAAYATDSKGFVIRGSQGECWRTGSWTPAQATIIGCDGVLEKAVPVPAPAPSPRPIPPEPGGQTPPEVGTASPPATDVPTQSLGSLGCPQRSPIFFLEEFTQTYNSEPWLQWGFLG